MKNSLSSGPIIQVNCSTLLSEVKDTGSLAWGSLAFHNICHDLSSLLWTLYWTLQTYSNLTDFIPGGRGREDLHISKDQTWAFSPANLTHSPRVAIITCGSDDHVVGTGFTSFHIVSHVNLQLQWNDEWRRCQADRTGPTGATAGATSPTGCALHVAALGLQRFVARCATRRLAM